MYNAHAFNNYWEPKAYAKASVDPIYLKRIEKEFREIVANPPQGISAAMYQEDLLPLIFLVTGPSDTAYQGGMFSFIVGPTPEYPMKPPQIKFLTTDENTVSIHPSFKTTGQVHLDLIEYDYGYSKCAWTPVMNLESLAVSIKSLFNKNPYPNFRVDEAKHYKIIISHETIRVAVIGIMEKKSMYRHFYFVAKMEAIFTHNYDHYIKVCKENMHLDGKAMNEKLGCFLYGIHGVFQFEVLLGKLERLKNERIHYL